MQERLAAKAASIQNRLGQNDNDNAQIRQKTEENKTKITEERLAAAANPAPGPEASGSDGMNVEEDERESRNMEEDLSPPAPGPEANPTDDKNDEEPEANPTDGMNVEEDERESSGKEESVLPPAPGPEANGPDGMNVEEEAASDDDWSCTPVVLPGKPVKNLDAILNCLQNISFKYTNEKSRRFGRTRITLGLTHNARGAKNFDDQGYNYTVIPNCLTTSRKMKSSAKNCGSCSRIKLGRVALSCSTRAQDAEQCKKLWKLLQDEARSLGCELLDEAQSRQDVAPGCFTSVQINKNFKAGLVHNHRKKDKDYQWCLSLGGFTGGGEYCWQENGRLYSTSTKDQWQKAEPRFEHFPAQHEPKTADRYSIRMYRNKGEEAELYYAIDESGCVEEPVLPPAPGLEANGADGRNVEEDDSESSSMEEDPSPPAPGPKEEEPVLPPAPGHKENGTDGMNVEKDEGESSIMEESVLPRAPGDKENGTESAEATDDTLAPPGPKAVAKPAAKAPAKQESNNKAYKWFTTLTGSDNIKACRAYCDAQKKVKENAKKTMEETGKKFVFVFREHTSLQPYIDKFIEQQYKTETSSREPAQPVNTVPNVARTMPASLQGSVAQAPLSESAQVKAANMDMERKLKEKRKANRDLEIKVKRDEKNKRLRQALKEEEKKERELQKRKQAVRT